MRKNSKEALRVHQTSKNSVFHNIPKNIGKSHPPQVFEMGGRPLHFAIPEVKHCDINALCFNRCRCAGGSLLELSTPTSVLTLSRALLLLALVTLTTGARTCPTHYRC